MYKVLATINLAQEKLVDSVPLLQALTEVKDTLGELAPDTQKSASYTKLDELKQLIQEKIEDISAPTLSDNEKVIAYLKEVMPKYVYYSNYGNLDSQIYLPQVLQNTKRSDLGVRMRQG